MKVSERIGKIAQTVGLGTVGIGTTIIRNVLNTVEFNTLADAVGNLQDKSFNKIDDIWTPDEVKLSESYTENLAQKSANRARNSYDFGVRQRKKVEEIKNQKAIIEKGE